jgi:hypothetical protein
MMQLCMKLRSCYCLGDSRDMTLMQMPLLSIIYLTFLKRILKVVFREGVQHRLLFCLSCVKMTVSAIRETEKSQGFKSGE